MSRLHTPTPGERLLYALKQLHRQWRGRATLTPGVGAPARGAGVLAVPRLTSGVEALSIR